MKRARLRSWVIVLAVLAAGGHAWAQSSRIVNGALLPCPDNPGCVSSQAKKAAQRVEPIAYIGTPAEARERLHQVIETLPRSYVVSGGEIHLHVACRSKWLRLTDDLDFLFDDKARLIHIRAASRSRSDDGGANRRRIEEIRAAYAARP